MRDKLGASVGGDKCQYAMLSEDMQEEELCKFRGSDSVVSRNEYGLLG